MVGYLLGGSLGLGIGLAIAAVTPRKWSFPANYPCEYTLYVVSDGFHTNFFVPVQTPVFDWRQHLNLAEISPQPPEAYQYLQFGWGDRIFYIETPAWDQVSVPNALRALFYWQNDAALFVKGHTGPPTAGPDTFLCLRLSQADYLALMQFIEHSFQTGPKGEKIRLASGQDRQSSFYAAQGSYSVLKTCNSWTADGLRAAQVNTPLWAGLATPLMRQLRNGCQCQS